MRANDERESITNRHRRGPMTVHGANLVLRAAVLAAAAAGVAVTGCAPRAGRSHEAPPPLPRVWKEAVARELEKPPAEVTHADLAGVTELSLVGAPVTDLAPLGRLPALRVLDLRYTRVADLAPVGDLPELWWLNLEGTRAADLTPLARLRHLTKVFLTDTGVADLAPLEALTRLRHLDLSGTRVTTIQPLKRLPNLETILLHGTPAVRQGAPPR
jgi:Leucine-rich repeat (LRR) protein